jgi:uncharacterized protein
VSGCRPRRWAGARATLWPGLDARSTLLYGAAALLAGLLADTAGLPGAWMIGPLLVAALGGLRGARGLDVPGWLYVAAQAVIGAATSASFTPETLGMLGQHALSLSLLVVLLLLFSVGLGLALARLTPLDRTTAVLGMLPGGAAVMVALSEALRADARLVAVMQYSRLLLVILSMGLITPLLEGFGGPGAESAASLAHHPPWPGYAVTLASAVVGAWLGVRWNLPGGAVVGPALLGALLGAAGVPHGSWPPGVLAAAFLLIGIRIGGRFDADSLRRAGRLALPIAWSMALLIAGCTLLAWGFAWGGGVDLVSAYLATTPGGLDTAVALALDTQANAALVIAVNMARFLAITLLAPPLLRRAFRGNSSRSQTADERG